MGACSIDRFVERDQIKVDYCAYISLAYPKAFLKALLLVTLSVSI